MFFREIRTAERVNENMVEQIVISEEEQKERERKLKEANDFWRQEFERIRKETNNED